MTTINEEKAEFNVTLENNQLLEIKVDGQLVYAKTVRDPPKKATVRFTFFEFNDPSQP